MDATVPVDEDAYNHWIEFSGGLPTLQQKKWITSTVLNKIESAADIAKRYNIQRKYINILVQRMRKRSYLRKLPGRPRVLDAESQQKIETSIVDMTCENDDHLTSAIKEEFVATRLRLGKVDAVDDNTDVVDPVKISRRSLKRYLTRFHPGVFEASDAHSAVV